MRQFTEKEILGFARALQTYMRFANGQKAAVKTYVALVEKALGQGLTMDELLNKENYSRAGQVSNNPSAEEYIDTLIGRNVAVHDLRDDEGWDEPENIKMLAGCFHDFFIEILPKGGTYLTAAALENIRKAILRYGLQTIMDESYIEKHKEGFEDESKHTCFQYLVNLLQNAEELGVRRYEDNMSEQQIARHREESIVDDRPSGTVKDVDSDDISDEDKKEAEKISGEDFNDAGDGVELEAEPGIDPEEEISPEYEGQFAEEEPEEEDTFISSSFNVNINPRDYKAQMIHDILIGLSFEELTVLNQMAPSAASFQELIGALARGEYNKDKETVEARNLHQFMNTELIRPFIECVRIEGIEMDDTIASHYDILLDDWDLRDPKTRKKDKIKNLIYQHLKEEDDPDLQSAIEDIEKLYTS